MQCVALSSHLDVLLNYFDRYIWHTKKAAPKSRLQYEENYVLADNLFADFAALANDVETVLRISNANTLEVEVFSRSVYV